MCSILGTPNEESWPGLSQLPDYKPTFPHWGGQELTETVPGLDDDGLDLLRVSFALPAAAPHCTDAAASNCSSTTPRSASLVRRSRAHVALPANSLLAKRAMIHPYFADYRP